MHTGALLLCLSLSVGALISQSYADSTAASHEADTALARNLSKSYLASVSPGSIDLKFGLTYICASYDEYSGVLTSRVFERYSWVDSRLKWDSTEGGVSRIRVPISYLWKPDITLYNAVEEDETRGATSAIVLANGTVWWYPPTTYKTLCLPKNKDGHRVCKLRLGSWAYSKESIDLELSGSGFDHSDDFYLDSCPYTVSNPLVSLNDRSFPNYPEFGTEVYPTYDVSFEIERRSSNFTLHHKQGDKNSHVRLTRGGSRGGFARKTGRRCVWPNCP